MEPTARSLRFASAPGSGSCLALGASDAQGFTLGGSLLYSMR
jgi:hypothetical protein